MMLQVNWEPYVLRYTKPGDKTYYIIRRKSPIVGLFSYYNNFAGQVRYALANGWLPVIDMKNYPNAYLEPPLLGKVNAWEYYFRQPFDLTLDEAYNGNNVIMSTGEPLPPGTSAPGATGIDFYYNVNNDLLEWRMLVKLGLFRIQPKILEDIMAEYNQLITKEDRVLGVLARGTDYTAQHPEDHPVQPSVDVIINTVKELRAKWNCNKIFLATEDYNIVVRMKEMFKDDCLVTKREYVHYDGRYPISIYHINRANDFFLLGKEYLTQMVILSKCNCLLTGMCSGATGAFMMTDGFEQAVVFNLGRYPKISLPPPVVPN